MGKLPVYSTLEDKSHSFDDNDFPIINTKRDFDEWFDRFNSDNKQGPKVDYIYRGMKEAKHKLFTSAQRQWITNDMEEWYPGGNYLRYIKELVEQSKKKPLLKKVFDVYKYNANERDIPILSILQHYGAPTPLIDWTYNINVALYFATENITGGNGCGEIDNYFSIYFVNKTKHQSSFQHLNKLVRKKLPAIDDINESVQTKEEHKTLFYISDFEVGRKEIDREFKLNPAKPITSIFNQNIIAQEGLFVLNPYPDTPIDDILRKQNRNRYDIIWDRPFSCFNIKKDLADYVRRRIKSKRDVSGETMDIDKSFIYPRLNEVVPIIHESLLNENIN